MNKTYRTATSHKVMCWILAVLCMIIVFLFPFAFVMIYIAHAPFVRVEDQKMVLKWFGTREVAFSDIESIEKRRTKGFFAAMMAPHSYTLKSTKKTGNIAVGAFEDSAEMLAEICKRAGLAVPS